MPGGGEQLEQRAALDLHAECRSLDNASSSRLELRSRMKVIAASKDADMAAPVAIQCLYSPLRSRLLLVCGLTAAAMLVMLVSYPILQPAISSQDALQQQQKPPLPARRPDVLHYIALDPSEAEERNKIRQLLEGGGSHRVWHENRMDRLARMEEHLDPYERSSSSSNKMTVLRHRSRDRWPADLSNPRFLPHIGQFKQLLQAWASKKRYEPQVMNELVDMVKVPVDRYYGLDVEVGSRRKYRSCAVVGNSGVLLKNTYGRAIDEHEMVIRLNNARVVGFEKWVGSKTTLLFVNSNIVHSCARRPRCSCQPYDAVAGSAAAGGGGGGGSRVPMVSYICQVAHLMHVVYCSSFDKAPLLVTDPRFDSLCSKLVKYYSLLQFFDKGKGGYDDWNKVHDGSLFHYSSGMQAVMLGLGICETVDLYGFGKVASAKHHYHTNQKAELALHDYEAEYALYDDIAGGKWESIPFLNETGLQPPVLRIFR